MSGTSDATIYHNPRCSKSRATLALLEDRKLDIERIEYLKSPPTVAVLQKIAALLGVQPIELIRFKDSATKSLGISPTDDRSDQQWLALMHANPAVIERPIVVVGNRAAIGRPPETVLQLLD